MDLELFGKGLDYAKKKKWVFVLGTLGLTVYGAYRVYCKKRQRLVKLFGTFITVVDMAIDSAEVVGVLSKDLKEFLQSSCDQVPTSLNQIAKIAKSDEFLVSLGGITRALTVGILKGYGDEIVRKGQCSGKGLPDSVVDKLLSDSGCGFASVVVGSFARNLVMGLYSAWEHGRGLGKLKLNEWVDVACRDKCREMIGDCIRVFVRTAVSFYLEKTMNVNPYNEFFSGLTNPKHVAEAREMLAYISSNAVKTFVRTCHCIWATNSKPTSGYSKIGFEDGFTADEKGSKVLLQGKKLTEMNQNRGWLSRKFVLDMTGMVTFETVRSCLEFLLEKLVELIKRSAEIFQQRGAEAFRQVTGKSSSVTTLCFNLCLNILDSPWILAPK